MAQNVLADPDVLPDKIINVGTKTVGSDIKVPYKDETNKAFLRLESRPDAS